MSVWAEEEKKNINPEEELSREWKGTYNEGIKILLKIAHINILMVLFLLYISREVNKAGELRIRYFYYPPLTKWEGSLLVEGTTGSSLPLSLLTIP